MEDEMAKAGKKSENKGERLCPLCNGAKTIQGICTCDMEWRGAQQGSEWEDCKCTPTRTCPTCNGAGLAPD
jgi:hypothetical protein